MTTNNTKPKPNVLKQFLTFLGISAPKLNDKGKLELDTEQHEMLTNADGDKAPAVIEKLETLLKTNTPPSAEDLFAAVEQMRILQSQVDDLTAQNTMLSNTPEPLPKPQVNQQAQEPQAPEMHDPKFLDGNPNHPWNEKTEDKPWNLRIDAALRGEKMLGSPQYGDVDLTNITGDLAKYLQMYGTKLQSWNIDGRELPSFWPTASGYADEGVWANIVLDEISQARKGPFLDKGNIKFGAERFKMFPIQVDFKITGEKMQALETTFIGRYNKISDNSQPLKLDFIAFVVTELLKQLKREDNLRAILGIYKKPGANPTVAGSAINAMRGLMQLLFQHIFDYKVMPFNIGPPQVGDYVHYAKRMVLMVPEQYRTMDLVLYISNAAKNQYADDYTLEYKNSPALMAADGSNYLTVKDFPNVKIVPMNYIGDSQFWFITTPDNIVLLDNVVGENMKTRVQEFERDMKLMIDYKKSIFFPMAGLKKTADSTDYTTQIIWCNNVIDPVGYVTMDADADLNVMLNADANAYHHSVQVGVNTTIKSITDIANVKDGSYVFVKGNTAATVSNVMQYAKIDATATSFKLKKGTFTLNENSYILLYKKNNLFFEVKRDSNAAGNTSHTVIVAPNATTLDATKGTTFITSTNTAATAITTITGAVPGVVYRIQGGGGTANASTIDTTNFLLSGTATLTDGKYVDVLFTGDYFMEKNRN